ncbi:MAG: class I SAM-dependent methyltransferase [Actinomycetota bacterium]|nr:class I SAM-dependent methyltransferase [Actinomycetota bacterium]
MIAETVRRFAGEPADVRIHTVLRALSCPFGDLLAEVPEGARLLDYGCGHGVFAALVAKRSSARVTGVDIDEHKVAVARRRVPPPADFSVVEPGQVPPGPWEAITVVDVLYLLPVHAQRDLLLRLAGELAPGGVLLVKEMHTGSRTKSRWMQAQERVMVDRLRRTKGDQLAFTDPAHLLHALEDAGLRTRARAVDRWYPHPHHLIVATRPREVPC